MKLFVVLAFIAFLAIAFVSILSMGSDFRKMEVDRYSYVKIADPDKAYIGYSCGNCNGCSDFHCCNGCNSCNHCNHSNHFNHCDHNCKNATVTNNMEKSVRVTISEVTFYLLPGESREVDGVVNEMRVEWEGGTAEILLKCGI